MLIVLFILFLVIAIVGIVIQAILKDRNEDTFVDVISFCMVAFGFFILFFVTFALLVNISVIVDERVIDKKKEMYQEENKNIEKQVTAVVNSYKDYEKEVITNATQMTAILLKLPEIKSNELVSKQIQIYVDNNNKIKELKEQKANVISAKWWVYFGN